jgi:hypothetical protein
MRSDRSTIGKHSRCAGMLVAVMACLVGCASNSGAVRCDGRLEPINAPAAKSAGVSTAGRTQSAREGQP